ncbi:hypothetical protein HDE_00396 [Halotydeus destructor]|nr:hypothetical protein HDE_00396 [Halotydeus destructor]
MFSLISSFKAVSVTNNLEGEIRHVLSDSISDCVKRHTPKDDLVIYKVSTKFNLGLLTGFAQFNGVVINLVSGFGHASDFSVRRNNSNRSRALFSFDIIARAPFCFYANMIVSCKGQVASTIVTGSIDKSDIILDCQYDSLTDQVMVKQLNIKFGSLPKLILQNGYHDRDLTTILNDLDMRNEFLEAINEPTHAYLMAYFSRFMSCDSKLKFLLRRVTQT